MICALGKLVGSGSYGEIYTATVANRGPEVALKRMIVIGESDFGFSYRETDICLKFGKHPNICGAHSVLYSNELEWSLEPPKKMRYDSLVLVMPLAKGDLYHLCKIEVLSEVRIKRMTAQVLLALEFIHGSGYIHRDIKPTNILYYEGDLVKICDFGLSKRYFPYDDHSSLVASDYFRPPEVLCLVPIYDYGVDIWALGCTIHFMHCSTMPCPEWDYDSSKYTSVAQAQAIIDSLPYEVSPDTLSADPIGRHLKYEMKTTSDLFFAEYRDDVGDIAKLSEFLIGGMLMFDHRHRLTARQLLDHPYLDGVESQVKRTRSRPMIEESSPMRLRTRRSCCTDLMYDTYIKCSRLDWYRDKVLFTAITMFDRTLSKIVDEYPSLDITEMEIRRYYVICLYISAKYYSASVDCDLTYESFPFPDLKFKTKDRAAELELYIVQDVLEGRIYHVSIYDVLTSYRKPRDKDVMMLLNFVMRGAHNGLTPQEAYDRWEDQALIT